MLKVLGTMAAFAVLATLALPGSATAAERRADGLKANQPGAETEFSSRRRLHRRHVVVRPAWGPRYGYYRPYHRPYYAGYPYGSYYAGSPYGYGFGYPYSRPGISIGFGFGPRWGW